LHRRQPLIALALAVLGLAAFGAAPAAAELRRLTLTLAGGSKVEVVVDVAPGTPVDQIPLPGLTEPVVEVVDAGPAPAGASPTATPTPVAPARGEAREDGGREAAPEDEDREAGNRRAGRSGEPAEDEPHRRSGAGSAPTPTPTPAPAAPFTTPAPTPTPAFSPPLPGAPPPGVPDVFIESFQIPPFLLPIYQAAAVEYGVRWEILAAINEIETAYGRNVAVSSAGAVGWMQFLPSSWRTFGVDASGDGKRDPNNPVDAIFAAARYLRAAGAERDLRGALFAYNHANWYVEDVLARARRIGAIPPALVGSLTGLAEGRVPVHGGARLLRGEGGTDLRLRGRRGAPVVAVNDGRIVRVGRSERLGRHVVLQDHYGNTFTFAHLGRVAERYAAPRPREVSAREVARELALPQRDARPSAPASTTRRAAKGRRRPARRRVAARPAPATKRRLFAHPDRPRARRAGGAEQTARGAAAPSDALGPLQGLDRREVVMRRLRKGARVTAGTELGRLARPRRARRAELRFEIRPAGRGAPRIDPRPIVQGWKLLAATAHHGERRRTATGARRPSIGQILLMTKEALIRRVLANPRITVYDCGRRDIRAGVVDRRVLAALEFLAASGLSPTVSSLRCGHGYYTKSGNVSHHSSGNAVDIAALNGEPVLGNQGAGTLAELAVQRLLTLQGTMRPDQIISLMTFEGADNTLAMADHADHLHVGWRPQFGANADAAKHVDAILEPDQWARLMERLGRLDAPAVSLRPSKHALEATKRPARRGPGEGE